VKISEVLAKLAELLVEHGDVDVKVQDKYFYGGCGCCGSTDYDWETPSFEIESDHGEKFVGILP
jgi:hypothetical protein